LVPSHSTAGGPQQLAAPDRRRAHNILLSELDLRRQLSFNYHCAACPRDFFPRDRALGVPDTSLSPAVTRMVGLTAAMVSFEESSERLQSRPAHHFFWHSAASLCFRS